MIKPKQKTCKSGTSKAKGFQGCGDKLYLHKYGLCFDCFKLWLTSTTDGKEMLKNSVISAKKKVEKEEKKEDKERKLKSKSIRGLIIEAKEPFQKLIRIRDHRKKCICCPDITLPFELGAYNAGHFKKAEIYSGLIFHPDNVNGQRIYCNKHLDGNEGAYAEGLKKRIGEERFNNLIELAVKVKDYKWDRQQLIDLKKHYLSELKMVESGKKDISEVDFSPGIICK